MGRGGRTALKADPESTVGGPCQAPSEEVCGLCWELSPCPPTVFVCRR